MKILTNSTTSSRTRRSFLFGMAVPKLLLCNAFSTTSPHRNAFIITTPSTPSSSILPSCPHLTTRSHPRRHHNPSTNPLYVYAPQGSGYIDSEDDIANDPIPETYKPTMGYPGTMRPGETPENQPYSSLPIADHDPDPVPWPHFQEIEWHHNWGSPHEHPIPMEEFIEMHGRWATVEMEAEVRKGARRGLRERRELEEAQKSASFILDDDDDDEEDVVEGAGETGVKLDLEEDMDVDLMIGSEMGAPGAATAGDAGAATADAFGTSVVDAEVEEEDIDDDFLLSLGLDGGEDDAASEDEKGEEKVSDDDFLLSLGIVPGEDDIPSDNDSADKKKKDDEWLLNLGGEGDTSSGDNKEDEMSSDDWLLSLGINPDDDGTPLDDSNSSSGDGEEPAFAVKDGSPDGILEAMQSMIDAEGDGEEGSSDSDIDLNFDDLDLALVDDGEDAGESGKEDKDDFALNMMEDGSDDSIEEEDDQIVPLDEMIGNEDMGDDDAFDDGGFDYD